MLTGTARLRPHTKHGVGHFTCYVSKLTRALISFAEEIPKTWQDCNWFKWAHTKCRDKLWQCDFTLCAWSHIPSACHSEQNNSGTDGPDYQSQATSGNFSGRDQPTAVS